MVSDFDQRLQRDTHLGRVSSLDADEPYPSSAEYHGIMRQLTSTVDDLQRIFTQDLTVLHIAEHFQAIKAEAPSSDALDLMHEHGFDVYGVEEGEQIIGFILSGAPARGTCAETASSFQLDDVVAETTPLLDIIRLLHKKERLYVLSKNRIEYIVTRADLQKAPIRMLLFSLVTLLEMQMLRLIHHYYPDGSWVDHVDPTRLDDAEKFHAKRLKDNEDISLADCLQFADKRDILLDTKEWITAIQHITSKRKAKQSLERLGTLRNHVAHGQDLLLGRSWGDLIGLISTGEQLLGEIERIQAGD